MAGVLNVSGSADSGLKAGITALRAQGANGTVLEKLAREGVQRLNSQTSGPGGSGSVELAEKGKVSVVDPSGKGGQLDALA